MVPGRVVVLGLEADDSCEEKCKSCGEIALGCLGISEFWTISDWTELGLVELSLSSFLLAVMSLAWVFIFAA